MHEIRFCRRNELATLQDFLRRQWRPDHIFVRDERLLRWQHDDRKADRLNFVVAENAENGQWDALLGFIPVAHFDEALAAERDVWLAIWKADDRSVEARGLGIRLLSYLKKSLVPHSIGSIGLSPAASGIYSVTGYTMGVLSQYYRLRSFRIARLPGAGGSGEPADLAIRDISGIDELQGIRCPYRPRKTPRYLWNRYALHPVYAYRLLGVRRGGTIVAALALRRVEAGGAACLRIVDIFGEATALAGLGPCLDRLLDDENAEYVDCLNHGIPAEVFSSMGFERRQGDEIVLPHHFEPFERVNHDVAFAYRTDRDQYVIFKGDSDQDRPNRTREETGAEHAK